MNQTRTCFCGSSFSLIKDDKFCSMECRLRSYDKTCFCGTEFKSHYRKQYCSLECKAKAKSKRIKKRKIDNMDHYRKTRAKYATSEVGVNTRKRAYLKKHVPSALKRECKLLAKSPNSLTIERILELSGKRIVNKLQYLGCGAKEAEIVVEASLDECRNKLKDRKRQ